MSDIKRAEYQRMVEANKRLERELRSIAMLDGNAQERLMQWRAVFIGQEKANDMVKMATVNFVEKYGRTFRRNL